MFALVQSQTNLKTGHLKSKTRPLDETLEKYCVRSRGHISSLILMKLSSVKMTDPEHYATPSQVCRICHVFLGVKRNKMNHKKIFFLKITKKKIS